MTANGDEGCTGEDFTDAVFADQEWDGRSFVGCGFTEADLRGLRTRSSLLGSTISDCRLRPWTLREVDLSLTALGHADLREVVLAGLRLTEANLVQADLRGADLSGADLTGARMLGARLEGADLRGARLDADALVQARLSGARIDVDTAIRFAVANGLRVDLGA